MQSLIKRKCFLSNNKNKPSVIATSIYFGECMEDMHYGSPMHVFLNFLIIKNALTVNLIYIDNEMDEMENITDALVGGFKTMDLVIEKMEYFITNYKNLKDVNLDNYKEQLVACNHESSCPMILSIDSWPESIYTNFTNKQSFSFIISNFVYIAKYSLDEVKTLLKELTKFRSDAYKVFKPILDKIKYKPSFIVDKS